MGTIYPTGYPIGGKCTEYKVNGIWELYIQPEYGRKSKRAQPLSQGVH